MKVPEFYKGYVSLLDQENLFNTYLNETEDALKFYKIISEEESMYRYDIAKWSIKEVLGHVCDTEQIFFFRLLSILRNEIKPLPGFDENDYVKAANFDVLKWGKILYRFELSRKLNQLLVEEISTHDLSKVGNANGSEISVESLLAIIIGHEKHHRNVIKERYLN